MLSLPSQEFFRGTGGREAPQAEDLVFTKVLKWTAVHIHIK